MSYTLIFARRALKQLRHMPKELAVRVWTKANALREEPRPSGCLKVPEFGEGTYRIRVGDARVVYRLSDSNKLIEVLVIDWRDSAYKKK